ncbi:hypothetical protein [Catellatospora coxensis]|uniref:Uncharacterized protein n=1 Tax=Catellatospora coxensis TaxID=310354 RepID=A0A8J3KUB8_9ACTN|nr:hypothetical protein [Catellatospora coxensis]GIG05309.1 hypothetical protein Cco03nite_20090 [Catellatospora coxensis]
MEQESPDVLSQEPTPSPAAPADFTDWVARRLPPLEHAARQLTGDDTQAATLARELLGLVAMRWSRLRGNDAEHHAPPGAAADRLLQRLFAREVADAVPQHRVRLDLDRTPPARRGRVLPATVEEEAAALWRRGRATTRRRLLIAGAVGAVALGAAGIRALAAGREEGRQPLSALPTGPAALDGVDEVPPVARQLALPVALVAKLPRELAPGDPARLPALSARPTPRALAVLDAAMGAAAAGPLLVLGEDGGWRRVDKLPVEAAALLSPGALAPDGARLAVVTADELWVVESAGGLARRHDVAPESPVVVWLGPRHLLVAVDKLLDVGSGALLPAPVGVRDAIAPRRAAGTDAPSTVLELLSAGDPITAPPRVRSWEFAGREHSEGTVAVTGPGAGRLGRFLGPGFAVAGGGGLVARMCEPVGLPVRPGWRPAEAVAVLDPGAARVRRLLVADADVTGSLTLLGWLDRRRVLLCCGVASGATPGVNQRLLVWDVRDGSLALVATVASNGSLSLADLDGAV